MLEHETMEVKLLTDVTEMSEGSLKTLQSGKVVSFPKKEALRLIRIKAATRPSKLEMPENSSTYASEEVDDFIVNLSKIDGINVDIAEKLVEAGFTTIKEVSEASVNDLVPINGIGKKSAKKIIESAEELVY